MHGGFQDNGNFVTFNNAVTSHWTMPFNGDGAFGFNGMEFDTAVRHNLPVVMILGNDSEWCIDKQIHRYNKNFINTPKQVASLSLTYI